MCTINQAVCETQVTLVCIAVTFVRAVGNDDQFAGDFISKHRKVNANLYFNPLYSQFLSDLNLHIITIQTFPIAKKYGSG